MQPPYNSLVMHNSFLYIIAHLWNQLPAYAKSSTTLAQFRARLNDMKFAGCQCKGRTIIFLEGGGGGGG